MQFICYGDSHSSNKPSVISHRKSARLLSCLFTSTFYGRSLHGCSLLSYSLAMVCCDFIQDLNPVSLQCPHSTISCTQISAFWANTDDLDFNHVVLNQLKIAWYQALCFGVSVFVSMRHLTKVDYIESFSFEGKLNLRFFR